MSFFEFPHTRTYDSDLGWLIKHVGSYDETIAALNEWIETNTPKIEDLERFKNAMESGLLPAPVQQAIFNWCATHLLDLVGATLKTVVFGLTDDGHFCAVFADSWSDIVFNTTEYDIWLPNFTEYGHLTLSV